MVRHPQVVLRVRRAARHAELLLERSHARLGLARALLRLHHALGQLARRALKTPAAFNSNARTSAERLYDRDPQPGMVWDRKRGWDVHARAPPVDERFLP